MGTFDIDEALNPKKRVLCMIGTWPKRCPTLIYRFNGYLTVFTLTALTITIFVAVFSDLSNIDSISFGVPAGVAAFHGIVNYYMVFSNKERFHEILRILKEPIFTLHENHLDVFLQEKIRLSNLWPPVLLYGSFFTTCVAIAGPLLDQRSERPLVVPFPIDLMEQNHLVYYAIYSFQAIGGMYVICSVTCLDGVFFSFVAVAAGQLRIVREKIIRCMNGISSETSLESQKQQEVLINNTLRECVTHHIAIERYIVLIEQIFRFGFLIQLLVSILETCFVGIGILVLPITSFAFIRGVSMLIVALIELLFFCAPGNEVIVQSEMIREACYMSEWTECSPSLRKTLLIIMERSKRPFSLTALNLFNLSHSTFIGVLQKSYSYFAVILHFYKTKYILTD